MTQPTIRLTVNGRIHDVDAAPDTALLYVLRNDLELNGPKFGCGLGECGACTVLIDGVRLNSCLSLAAAREGDKIVTIEGLAEGEKLHPMQAAFVKADAFQCGFCTPGILMSFTDFLARNPHPTEEEIREVLSGHLCRCTGYAGIVAAIKEVAGGDAT